VHVVYVTSEFVTESQGGGLASYISNISRILADRGHTVTVVTSSEKNDDSLEWYPGVKVERVKISGKWLLVPLYRLWESWRLHNRVKTVNKLNKISIVQYASFNAVGFFYVKKVPSVVRISSDCVCWRKYKIYDYKNEDINELCLTDKIEYAALKRIGTIYGPSYATAEIISKRIGCKIPIIESPFYLKRTEFDDSLYNEKLKDRKYYLAHSSMSCLKGTHVIAQVIKEVCQKDEEACFVFAGSDHGIFYRDGKIETVKEYIIRMAGEYSERVFILGAVKREKLFPIIENAYACLMPSRIDNMPNTCIEAMAMGKIVIGTKGASYEQFIEDGISGYLMDIDDKKGLIDAIDKVTNMSEDEKNRMSIRAMGITKRFEPEKVYQSIISYYEKVIEEKKGKCGEKFIP